MCGRYALFSVDAVRDRYGVGGGDATPTYNAAPGQDLPVIDAADPNAFTTMEWGLVPSWTDDGSEAYVNARAETVREKASFASAYADRRCLVPADGFYEWRDGVPYYFERADSAPFAMAGVWEPHTPETTQAGLSDFGDASGGPDRSAETRRTFAVVTTEATGVVADYHHRSSVLLGPEEAERWLAADDPADLLDPDPPELSVRRVSTDVDDPSVDRPDLVESV